MKILVCISKTPDTTTKINFSSDGKFVNYDGVKFILNPYDEHALSKAMELKEKLNAEITVIHMGSADGDQIIRKCFAIGVDRGVRIDGEPIDGQQVAAEISKYCVANQFDLILTGRESIDYNGGIVGELIAAHLKCVSISYCFSLEVDGNRAIAKRFVDGGEETIQCELPIVISAVKELGEPRIPNMKGIMMSRSKPIELLHVENNFAFTSIESYETPIAKAGCIYINAEESEKLIEILHTEKKLI